jgi:hypothetical protein
MISQVRESYTFTLYIDTIYLWISELIVSYKKPNT